MSRYIDAEKLGIGTARPEAFVRPEYALGWNSAIEIIKNAPTVDVVEVVRCKDCKCYKKHFCNEFGDYVTDYEFCSRGEKREGGNDK